MNSNPRETHKNRPILALKPHAWQQWFTTLPSTCFHISIISPSSIPDRSAYSFHSKVVHNCSDTSNSIALTLSAQIADSVLNEIFGQRKTQRMQNYETSLCGPVFIGRLHSSNLSTTDNQIKSNFVHFHFISFVSFSSLT